MNLEVQGVSTFFDAPLRHTLLSFTRLELILVEINILFSFVTHSIYLKRVNENIFLFSVTYHAKQFLYRVIIRSIIVSYTNQFSIILHKQAIISHAFIHFLPNIKGFRANKILSTSKSTFNYNRTLTGCTILKFYALHLDHRTQNNVNVML